MSCDDSTPGCRLLPLLEHAFDKASEHVRAGRHNCVCTECSVARVASLSPEDGARTGVGRGWRIDGDGWSARSQGRGEGRLVCRSRPRCYGGETN